MSPKKEIRLKLCPFCSRYMQWEARRCPDCNRRVGRADKAGKARKPINWLSYLICIVSWAVLIFYLWWAFWRD